MSKNTLQSAVTPTAAKIAIIEARPMFRKGLVGVFNENWKAPVVIESEGVEEFVKDHSGVRPDVVLVGLDKMDERNASQRITLLNAKLPETRIILYDYAGNLKMIPRLLRLGIYGYLTADFDVSELRLCLETVLEGKRFISNDIIWEYLNQESQASIQPKTRLSKMEEVVANYLTQGMSVSKIAEAMSRQISTISTVKAKVFKKMNVGNVLDLKDRLQKDGTVYAAGM